MFEESLVESTAVLGRRSHRSVAFSIGIQSLLAAGLLALPMVHPELLPLHAPTVALVAPLPKPVPPPVPAERVHVNAPSSNALSAPSAPEPAAPLLGPRLLPSSGPEKPPSATGISLYDGPSSTGPPGFASASSTAVTRAVAHMPAAAPSRARISSGVSQGLLLEPIRATYPPIAKVTHTEGTVVVQAIISKRGAIESAHVLSGPAILQQAALEAVESARYRPYLLNGEPTEVDTTISIVFHLGGS